MSKSQSVITRKAAPTHRAVAIRETVVRRLKKIGAKHNPPLKVPATIEYCVGIVEGLKP